MEGERGEKDGDQRRPRGKIESGSISKLGESRLPLAEHGGYGVVSARWIVARTLEKGEREI
jgi:hypothetical protein